MNMRAVPAAEPEVEWGGLDDSQLAAIADAMEPLPDSNPAPQSQSVAPPAQDGEELSEEAEVLERVATLLSTLIVKVERLVQIAEKIAAAPSHNASQQMTAPTYAPPPLVQQPPPPFAQPQQGAPTGVPWGLPSQGGNGMQPNWVCPDHGQPAKWVPPGNNKRTQKPYPGFWACPVFGCRQKVS